MTFDAHRELPRGIGPGDRIEVVAPAGRPDLERLERGVALLEGKGFRVTRGKHLHDSYGHLAGADRDRAADLMEAFLNPEVAAVFCARGGVGCARLVRYLDLQKIIPCPKVFVGYSDVTVLHLALARAAGWPTFYGPMVAVEMGESEPSSSLLSSLDWLWKLISGDGTPCVLPALSGNLLSDRSSYDNADGESASTTLLAPGKAEGRLTGGTLCLVESSLGTSYAVDATGSILALEDIHERPWRVDRMLTHLEHAGVLSGVKGFLIGELTDVTDPDELARELAVETSISDHLGQDRPILYRYGFGHIPAPLTLPFNCRCQLDAGNGTLELLEPAVHRPIQ